MMIWKMLSLFKQCAPETVQSVASNSFLKRLGMCFMGPKQGPISQPKQGIEMWLSRKVLWKSLLSDGLDSQEFYTEG